MNQDHLNSTPRAQQATAALDVDRPLHERRDDALGRLDFARSLALLISSQQSAAGSVIALCGTWGSGKSTLLNFVETYLKDPKETSEGRRPILIRFNPWWFSSAESLLRQFLNTFRAGLSQDTRLAGVVQDIGAYADSLASLAALVPQFGPILAWFARTFGVITKTSQTPEQIRRRIDAKLEQSSKHVLVIIDDIDRLPRQEIREMLKVVKSVADFPKTIYLLAFDKDAVVAALDDTSNDRGAEYLRKIVQLEIDVPLPDPIVLRHLLHVGLERLLGNGFEVLRDSGEWESVYQEGARHILRTLRDAKRYLNALSITYPFVRSEVHPLDFLIIELIRVVAPGVYAEVRGKREWFAGGDSDLESAAGGGTPAERRPFYEAMVNRLPDDLKAPVLRLLQHTFPKVSASYGGRPHSSGLNEQWRRGRRICSPEVFPVYFQLGVPVGEISAEAFRAVCELAPDRQRFAGELLSLAKPSAPGELPESRLLSFLQRLADHPEVMKEPVNPDRLGACIGALLDAGDPVYLDAWENLRDSSIDDMVVFTLGRLLDESVDLTDSELLLSQLGRFERLRDGITSTRSLYIPVLLVSALDRANRRTGAIPAGSGVAISQEESPPAPAGDSRSRPALSHDRLDELKRLICEKLDRAAADMSLISAPRLAYILTKWEAWCGEGARKRAQFVQRLLETELGLARLLGAYLQASLVHLELDDPGRVRFTMNLRGLSKDLGDRDAMNNQYERATRIRLNGQEWVTPRLRMAIAVFGGTWRRAGSQIPGADDE